MMRGVQRMSVRERRENGPMRDHPWLRLLAHPAQWAGLALCIALGASTAVAATGTSNVIVPPSAVIAGHTYAQWEAKAQQWEIANERFYDSAPPKVPRCVAKDQHGVVWFLGGNGYAGAGNSITRLCDIPAGRYLFIDGPGFECSTVEAPPFHATSDAGLRRCARSFAPTTSTLTLDGKPVFPAGFATATQVFRFVAPPRDNILQVSGATHGRGAAYARSLMLGPLSDGPHVLVHTQEYSGGPVERATYHLTIGG
jgi:hypothetical protein